jgi:hypothetical protein
MPVPPPGVDFFDRAVAAAASQPLRRPMNARRSLRGLVTAWETWVGAAIGAAAAAGIAVLLLRPPAPSAVSPVRMTLSVNETRSIDVMIASERELPEATIRIFVSGSIELDGFDHEREIDWRTRLERGSNLLSVPVVARSAGPGRLIAIIEHDGRTRQVAIDLAVVEPELRS